MTQRLNGLRPYHFAVATIISGCLEELLGLIGSDEPSLASLRSLPRAWKCCCWRMPEAHKYLPNTSAVHPSDLWVHALFLVSLEPGPSAWLSFRLANAEGPPDFFFDSFCIEDWHRPHMCIGSTLLVNVTSLIFFAVKRFREPKEERRPWRIWWDF